MSQSPWGSVGWHKNNANRRLDVDLLTGQREAAGMGIDSKDDDVIGMVISRQQV